MNEDILNAEEALRSMRNVTPGAGITEGSPSVPINVGAEIESSLLYLLKHRIARVERDASYEDSLKQAILDRLPEATFSELISALKMVQQESNNSTGNILKPFIPSSERVPLMDNNSNDASKEAGELAFENAPKEVLQSLGELAKLIKLMGNTSSPTSEAGASSTDRDQ